MDPPANNEKIAPDRSLLRNTAYVAISIIVIQVLVAVITYPFMPASVPSHWGAAGHVDGYTPRLLNAILLPGISIGLYLLLSILSFVSSKLGNQSQRSNKTVINLFLFLVAILFLILTVQVMTTALVLR